MRRGIWILAAAGILAAHTLVLAEGTTETAGDGTTFETGDLPVEELFTDTPVTVTPVPDLPAEEEPVNSGFGYSGEGYMGFGYSGGTQAERIWRQPKLLLLPESLPKEPLPAGQSVSWCLSAQNANGNESIYNLKVTVKPAQEEIVLGVSSFYFGKVAPKGSISLPLEVSVGADAPAGRIPVTVSFEYENVKGTVYSDTEDFSVEISQPAQAVIEGFQIPGMVYSMETVELPVQIINTGKATIYNARVELEGEGLFAVGPVFAGNVEAGGSCEGTLRVYVGNKNMTSLEEAGAAADEGAYGPAAGTLIFTFEDACGEQYRQSQEFSTVIREPQMVELTVGEPEARTNQWWVPSLVLLLLVFFLILLLMEMRLRRSRNILADLLAEQNGEK